MKLSIIFAALLFGACSQTTEPNITQTAAASLPERTEWSAIGQDTSSQFRNAVSIAMERLSIASLTNTCGATLTLNEAGLSSEQSGYNGHRANYVIIGRLHDTRYAGFLGAHKSISLNPTLDTLVISSETGEFAFFLHSSGAIYSK